MPKKSTLNLKRKANHAEQNQPDTTDADESPSSSVLTTVQRARVENNRLKALQIRKAKAEAEAKLARASTKVKCIVSQPVDTGAGFFVEEEEEDNSTPVTIDTGPIIPDTSLLCDECGRPFTLSFLRSSFDVSVCDLCKDEDKFKLITRTTAKTRFLLKDVDLDKREPILRFITKRNPRNTYWGEMKLYLESQVYDRAMEIWKSMEAIEEEVVKRKINSAKAKAKKYDKKMKDLRMEVRSSLYTKELAGHKHEYGDETYNSTDDTYSKACTTCDHKITYEKM